MNRLEALRVANVALSCALVARKAHVPGDLPEDHEDNTYGLPEGAPIRRKLRAFFAMQLRHVVGFVSKIGAQIPATFPSLADYDDPMASAMTPIIGTYWDKAGKALNGRLGLDPDEWRVTDPNLHRAIKQQSFHFCAATNATTHLRLDHALQELRRQFHEGLIDRGETVDQLTRRVQGVFRDASKERARMIAQTEASRAVHTASEMSAIASGVVSAKRIMLSANSCFAAGSQVLKWEDGSVKAVGIETLAPGDMVIGGSGKPRRVLAVASRHYCGDMIAGPGFTATPDHRFLTRNGWRPIGQYADKALSGRLQDLGVVETQDVPAALREVTGLPPVLGRDLGPVVPVGPITEDDQLEFVNHEIDNPLFIHRDLLAEGDSRVSQDLRHADFQVCSARGDAVIVDDGAVL